MARRHGSILGSLVMASWWVSVFVATAAYAFVAYIMPAMLGPQDRLVGPLAQQLPSLAPFVALAFLLPAPLAALRQWRARRLLDSQTGPESIRGMGWQQFESLVAEAHRRKGYAVEETGGSGPDGGIDLVVRKDGSFLVQCKHWKAYRVGVREARELLGVVTAERAAGRILVTSGRFTPETLELSRSQPIELVAGPRLLELVRLAQRGQATVAAVLASEPVTDDAATPACPTCRRPMVLRIAKRGAGAGQRFWGCSGYPGCRGTRDLAVSSAVS